MCAENGLSFCGFWVWKPVSKTSSFPFKARGVPGRASGWHPAPPSPYLGLLQAWEGSLQRKATREPRPFILFDTKPLWLPVPSCPSSVVATSTRLPTLEMMTMSPSSPLQCLWRRGTPSSSSPGLLKTWYWWMSWTVSLQFCLARYVALPHGWLLRGVPACLLLVICPGATALFLI